MEHTPESGRTTPTTPSLMSDKLSRSPSKVPLASSGSSFLSASTRKMPQSSSRSLMTMAPPPSRSGGRATPPAQLLEMSVTEQIARKARKSTVLNDKNALLILAIPDYDDYKILQPYSCRSLSNKSKFVGGKDFITRHNPQEVNEFKKQYSRDVGNLNRQRSIVAPPTTVGASQLLSSEGSLSGSSSLAFFESQSLMSPSKTSSSNSNLNGSSMEIWRQAFTADQKSCWVLTDFGIESLIGPEYRITTRVPMLPSLSLHSTSSSRLESSASSSPSFVPSLRSPLRPETPLALASFTERDSAQIGVGANLLDEKQLASLSRIAAYSSKSRPPSPPRSPYRAGLIGATLSGALTDRSPSKVHQFGHMILLNRPSTDPATSPSHRAHLENHLVEARSLSPSQDYSNTHSSASPATTDHHHNTQTAASPTIQPFAMEISPPRVTLGTLRRSEVYLFPIRVRNVGFKQERFRVKHVGASCAGFEATIAEASYDRESARLAPGLAAILTLTLCFQHPGKIFGSVQVETEGVGSCEVEIRVRAVLGTEKGRRLNINAHTQKLSQRFTVEHQEEEPHSRRLEAGTEMEKQTSSTAAVTEGPSHADTTIKSPATITVFTPPNPTQVADAIAESLYQLRVCPDDMLYSLGDVLEYWHAGSSDKVGVDVPRVVSYFYALYVGRGRLIHSRSYSSRDFRVRVDTLASMRGAGFVIRKCTDEMTACLEQILGVTPLRDCNSISRATSVLHAHTSSRASSMSLILYAHYGDAILKLAESFLAAFADNCGCLAHATSKKKSVSGFDTHTLQLLCSKTRLQALDENFSNFDVAPAPVISTTAKVRFADFLNTPAERAVSTWLISSVDAVKEKSSLRRPKLNGYVALFMRTSKPAEELPAILVYKPAKKTFECVFKRLPNVPERLVEDNMECSICFEDLRATAICVFQCSHFVCESCVHALRRKKCPFCRQKIEFTRVVTEKIKERAAMLLEHTRCCD